jgi:signal transduction histidine kinase
MENKRLPKWIAVGVTFAVALAATTSILSLRRWADYASQSTLQMAQLQLSISRLDGLEWRAIAAKKLNAELQKEVEETKIQSATLLQKLSASHQNGRMEELHQSYNQYIAAIDREFILLNQGKIEQAQIFDEEQVDPTYDRLDKLLIQCKQESSIIAERINQQADIGTILSIVAAAVAISFTLQKIGRVTRLSEIAIAEQKVLLASEAALQQERALLAARVIERTQELDDKNQVLSATLKQLQSAQSELIESEKMVALGHLVAGIAHEINTPLGAIKASTGNLTKALQSTLAELPQVVRRLTTQQEREFFALLDRVLQSKAPVTSAEKRPLKRTLTQELETHGLDNARQLADRLVDLGIQTDIEPFVSLLQSDQRQWVLELIYNLSRIQANNQIVQIAVDRAAKIVFALKSYARFDQTGEQQQVRIVEGIETVLELYQNQMKHGIKTIRTYEPIPEFLGYPDELIQVWTNLIHNAIQGMANEGTLEIVTKVQHDLAIVQIIDSGSGISPATQAKIFDPFFTTKPAGEGSGLGLSISQTIVEKHGGKITVNSQSGYTIFTVSIPLTLVPTPALNDDAQVKDLTLVAN